MHLPQSQLEIDTIRGGDESWCRENDRMDRYEKWAAYEVDPVDYEDWEEDER